MCETKKQLDDRAARIKQATDLIEEHGPLSCKKLAELMSIRSVSATHTLTWLLRAGTHYCYQSTKRDEHSNLITLYACKGAETQPKKIEKKSALNTVTERARQAIIDAEKTDHITAEWLAGVMKILPPQANETLRGLCGLKELEIQSQVKSGGRTKKVYRTTVTLKRCKFIEVSQEQAALSIQHRLFGWRPNPERFFSLRDST